MKKFMVIGLVLTMVMGLAAMASALTLDDVWNLNIRIQDGTLSQGTAVFGTGTGFSSETTPVAPEDAYYATNNAAGEIISTNLDADNGGHTRWQKDQRAPLTELNSVGNAVIWNLKAYSYNATAAKNLKLNVWMNTAGKVEGDVKVMLFQGAVTQEDLTWIMPLLTTNDGKTAQDLGNGKKFWYTFSKDTVASTVSPAVGNGFVPTDAQIKAQVLSSVPATGQDFTMVAYAPVPEPGSILALASGLVGLVGFGIRRRK